MATYELVLTETEEILKIVLSPMATELDEVTLKKRKRKTQKRHFGRIPRKHKSGQDLKRCFKQRTVLHHLFQVISGKDLVATGPDFLTSLLSYSPSMRVVRVPEVKGLFA